MSKIYPETGPVPLDYDPLPLAQCRPASKSTYYLTDEEMRDYVAIQSIPELIRQGFVGRTAAVMAYDIANYMIDIRSQERG